MAIDYTTAELLVIVSTAVLLSLLLADAFFDWKRLFSACDNSSYTCSYWEFSEDCGPSTCRTSYSPDSRDVRQSPINIDPNYAVVFPAETLPPINFSTEHNITPCSLRICNDGHCVTLYGRWPDGARPTICGGPLDDKYQFLNARFRWGPNDEEGSEHTIDSHMFAMELQATYSKADKRYFSLPHAAEQYALLTISYFFQVVPVDNPNLKFITSALKRIRSPFHGTVVGSAPLSYLMPPFSSKYYNYQGSLTFPPCTEGVQWLIQTEPLAISSKQVSEFRKLTAANGPMELNTRPVQDVNGREVCFYE